MAFASDTFTGTAGTVLDGRTADLGGAWTRNTNTGAANVAVLDSANAARVNVAQHSWRA
ncbi:MAG: hypothetical protein JWO59_755 [Chloroflexi bacterium]|nr:hypothetical protein [Chloroflexota bacterium]